MDVSSTREGQGVARGATLVFTSDATAVVATLGFRPKSIVAINLTDATRIEKVDGMLDTQTLQTVTAGTTTVPTSSQIVIDDNGFTLSAAAAGTAKDWVVFAQ